MENPTVRPSTEVVNGERLARPSPGGVTLVHIDPARGCAEVWTDSLRLSRRLLHLGFVETVREGAGRWFTGAAGQINFRPAPPGRRLEGRHRPDRNLDVGRAQASGDR